jgi:hypothetical protein
LSEAHQLSDNLSRAAEESIEMIMRPEIVDELTTTMIARLILPEISEQKRLPGNVHKWCTT